MSDTSFDEPMINYVEKQGFSSESPFMDTFEGLPQNNSLKGKDPTRRTRKRKLVKRKQWKDTRNGSYYLKAFLIKLIHISTFLNIHIPNHSSWGSKLAAWTQISKREFLLRLPSVCKKSVDYYILRIVVTPTAKFLLKMKKFRPGSYYRWYKAGEKSQSSSPAGSAFNSQIKSSNASSSSGNSSRLRSIPFYSYFKSLKWFPIPLSVGFAVIAYQHYKRVLRRAGKGQKTTFEDSVHQDWEITCYRAIPWNSFSRAWGYINSVTLPEWSRSYVLGWYASRYQCDLNEAETDDFRQYKNLGEFFRRNLKSGLRPIDPNSPIVSPSDGKIFHLGKADYGIIEQVKGVTYSLQTFLGPVTWNNPPSPGTTTISFCDPSSKIDNEKYCSGLIKHGKETSLFYTVIYLAPGDYHRFHSPTDWNVKFRRHFAGELLSVNPVVANWIGGLFSLNERAVYIGEWEHGFFSMTAVGATNVGSIRVYGDPDLHTNSPYLPKNTHHDLIFKKPITLKRGESFGEFNFGSTIVLIYEAPNEFVLNLKENCVVKMGQGMVGDCVSKST